MDRIVTIIEPEVNKGYSDAEDAIVMIRVAAYVRISTDSEDQKTSYNAQLEFYTKKINENPEWKLASIYDGTSYKGIAEELIRRKIKTPTRKDIKVMQFSKKQ